MKHFGTLRRAPIETEAALAEPIAVIGLDCIFPGAPDAKGFWQNILNKVSAIGDPLPAWNADLYLNRRGSTATQKGGYLKDLYRFNPVEFGIMPTALDGGEPDQFLALDLARRALADAGAAYLDPGYDHTQTGVILGHSPYYHRGQINTAQHNVFVEQTRELIRAMIPAMTAEQEAELERLLKKQLPAFNADISPGLVPNVLTGRIANRLNLRGPNYMVDAACASSLLAVGAAIDELRAGRSRIMLAGGVNASLPPEVAIIFTQLDALSKRGEVRPFSSQADGTLLGEGLGVVVLKRLGDALEDGDKIYSLLHGVGQSSDGRGLGLLAPSQDGEVLAMRRAYEATALDPETVTLIEAHGTGIPLGDRTEVSAMAQVFGARDGVEGRVAVGSVKSMISHTIPAAGIASIIKTSLALHHKVLPPSLCEEVSPDLGIQDTALYVNSSPRPWIHRPGRPRRAGVNAFGFGGVNAHAILEEAPANAVRPRGMSPWEAECCVLAADNRDQLLRSLDRLQAFLDARPDVPLADIAQSLWHELPEKPGPQRLSIVASDHADLGKKIAQARKKLAKGGGFATRNGLAHAEVQQDGKLAFMFPGEGSQYPFMLADLARHFPSVRGWLDFWSDVTPESEPLKRTDIVYPRESELTDARREELRQKMFSMAIGSEASFVAGLAMHDCLRELGVTPDAMVGHSTGESAALVAAGVVRTESPEELVEGFRKITSISRMIEADGRIPTGALIAVGLIDIAEIGQVVAGTSARIAMENCPNQTILFVAREEAESVMTRLAGRGAVCEILPFDRGYHTPAFQPVEDAFDRFYAELGVNAPYLPLYSCAGADVFPDDIEGVRQLATSQWSRKVRFSDVIRKMHADGVRTFVEVGAGGKLASFAEQILADAKGNDLLIAASNLETQPGMASLLHLMGRLFVSGHVSLDRLFADRALGLPDLDETAEPKPRGMFLDNSIPKIAATPELTAFLHDLLPTARPAQIPADAAPAGRDFPFLTRVTVKTPDALEARVALDVGRDRYLQDHVLSGPVSEDPDLHGLPCVPLMASLEIMAEAAAALLGRRDLCLVENLASRRWLVLEEERSELTVRAARISDSAADVEIFKDGKPAVHARLGFGEITPPAEGLPEVVAEEDYCAPGAYETYEEHIFHGPVFQSIEHVTAWSRTGIEATLSDVTLNGFFRDGETPDTILNPVLFDALTQLTAFWLAQEIGPHFASFPRSIPRIEIYADVGAECDGLWLRGHRSGALGNGQDGIWSLAAYCGASPVLRVDGLQNAFSELPAAYYPYSLEPINGWFGHPLDTGDDRDGLTWNMPLLADEFWGRIGGVFLRVLGFSTLTPDERGVFTSFGDDLAARAAWLMPRVAVKEAARYWAYCLTGGRLHSADIFVEETGRDSFVVQLPQEIDGAVIEVVLQSLPGAIRANLSPIEQEFGETEMEHEMEVRA